MCSPMCTSAISSLSLSRSRSATPVSNLRVGDSSPDSRTSFATRCSRISVSRAEARSKVQFRGRLHRVWSTGATGSVLNRSAGGVDGPASARGEPRLRGQLPASPSEGWVQSEQHVEGRADDACCRSARCLPGSSLLHELPTTSDHHESVQVEDGESDRVTPIHLEPRTFEQDAEIPARVMTAVADVPVERRHRPAGHGDEDTTL